MTTFYRVRDVAGCNQPRSTNDIQWLEQRGIRAYLSLSESGLNPAWVVGRRYLHVPVRDFMAPTIDSLYCCVDFLSVCVRDQLPPVTHCTMGHGRTGTVLAAYLIYHGAYPADAIAEVRAACPAAIETDGQTQILYDFADNVRRA
jgi:atypical dual specificity phosphatase